MSQLISRPVDAIAASVKRRASVPCASIPPANTLRVSFSILAASFGCIMLPVRFCTRSSSSMPSIMSSGSSTLPFDLDILSPLSSRIKPVTYTVLNGTCGLPFSSFTKCSVIIIMRATQKKIISKPVTSTSDGWKVFKSSVFSGQPCVEKVQSADENHVSSTSSSWLNVTLSAMLFSRRTSASSRPTNTLPSLSYQAGMR